MISIRLMTQSLADLRSRAVALAREGELAEVGAVGAANVVRDHLYKLDNSAPNQMFGKRTHFYSSAAKSITVPAQEGNAASFTITKVGLAQRWLGGTIRAGSGPSSKTNRPTRYLAIPARAETYGRTPGEFNDLQFVPRGPGKAMLVQTLQSALVGAGGKRLKNPGARAAKQLRGSLVMFWLATEVRQEGDPNVMPTKEEMSTAAAERMENYLSRLLQT